MKKFHELFAQPSYAKIDADQLPGNHAAGQLLCFLYIDNTIPLLPKSLAIFCGCIASLVSHVVGNSKDSFSHDMAQIIMYIPVCKHAHEID